MYAPAFLSYGFFSCVLILDNDNIHTDTLFFLVNEIVEDSPNLSLIPPLLEMEIEIGVEIEIEMEMEMDIE